jgi:hypothetical protein
MRRALPIKLKTLKTQKALKKAAAFPKRVYALKE